jgi:hypothetical protein
MLDTSKDGRSKKEIASRINQAKDAFNMKRKLFVSSNISLQIRKNLVKAYVWSNAWYGSETWIIGDTKEEDWRHSV